MAERERGRTLQMRGNNGRERKMKKAVNSWGQGDPVTVINMS
jgi:hypothetical protein